jgi:hypothetical protein
VHDALQHVEAGRGSLIAARIDARWYERQI